MRQNLIGRVLGVCALSMLLGLSACGQGNQPASTAAPEEEQLIMAYSWHSIAPALFMPGPPASLQLSDAGYAYAVFTDTPASAGQTLTATYIIQGDAERVVLILLSRHCDIENGEDNARAHMTLTGQPQAGEITHTFGASYSCVRVSFHSNDGSPMMLSVSEVNVTAAPPQ